MARSSLRSMVASWRTSVHSTVLEHQERSMKSTGLERSQQALSELLTLKADQGLHALEFHQEHDWSLPSQ